MSGNWKKRRSKAKRDRPSWWQVTGSLLRVWKTERFCYLIAYPRWGYPFVRARLPTFLGIDTVRGFIEAFDIHVGNAMKKPVDQPRGEPGRAAPVEDCQERLAQLADHLTALHYEGDPPEPRLPSTLLIFAEKGCWKAMLKDKNRAKCLWVTAASLWDIFDVMELALLDEHPDWRDDRAAGAPQASRQKK